MDNYQGSAVKFAVIKAGAELIVKIETLIKSNINFVHQRRSITAAT
jgi:hypothetical protein